MTPRKQDMPHNSPEQVREYLEDAVAIADELTGRDERWPIVFTKAVDLYSAKQVFFEQINPGILNSGIPLRP